MSKEKTPKLKKKSTPFDIVSRVLTAVLALGVPAALYFLNIIFYEFESSALGIIASLRGDEGDTGITYGYISINGFVKDILPIIRDHSGDGDSKLSLSEIWTAFEPLHGAIYATIAFFALILVIALALIICSCVTKSNKIPLILSVLGLAFSIAAAVAFRRVTGPIVSGEFDLSRTVTELLATVMFGDSGVFSLLTAILGALSGALFTFTTINFSTGWVITLIIFFFLIFWHGAALIMNIGSDEKVKKPSPAKAKK